MPRFDLFDVNVSVLCVEFSQLSLTAENKNIAGANTEGEEHFR